MCSSSSSCHRQDLHLLQFPATPQAIVQFVVLTFPQYSFATTSSHLVIKLQMVFCADMLNFFDQESVMPGPPLFCFKPTVVFFPSNSVIVSLFFPRTSAIVCASSSAYSDVIVLFTCVNLLNYSGTVSLLADSQWLTDIPSQIVYADHKFHLEGLLLCSVCHYRR